MKGSTFRPHSNHVSPQSLKTLLLVEPIQNRGREDRRTTLTLRIADPLPLVALPYQAKREGDIV